MFPPFMLYGFGGSRSDIGVLLTMVRNRFLGEKRCCQVSIWYFEFFCWLVIRAHMHLHTRTGEICNLCIFQDEKRNVVECYLCTINQKVFAGKVFRQLNFCVVFIFVAITTQRNKISLFICGRKYFAGLIFVIEGDL